MISIVTATYNRAHLLPRLYESLKSQENKDFEWVVVDDGSVDNTENLIMEFKAENLINIQYIKKDNGGKHTALNLGVSIAKYGYTFFLDSDDYLPVNSVESIVKKVKLIKSYPNYSRICGVCGDNVDTSNKLIGDSCPNNVVMNYLDFRYKLKINGDKTEVFKTEILNKFKFPEFVGEKFCPEALVWNRIALQYDMFFFNEAIYVRDYQNDGLTSKIVKIRKASPKSTQLYYKELFANTRVPLYYRLRAGLNFLRFKI